ncbi:MAG: hypothetical protein VW518_03325 [Burkholderiaceae bacterium]
MIDSGRRYRVHCYYNSLAQPVISIFSNRILALGYKKQVLRQQKGVARVIVFDENDAEVIEK